MKSSATRHAVGSRAVAVLLCVAAFASAAASAQDAVTGLGFVYAYHFFQNDDSTTLVELSYQFSNRGVTYRTDVADGAVHARLRFDLLLHRVDEQPADTLRSTWENVLDAPAAGDTTPHAVMALRRLGIAPGKYVASLIIDDVNDPQRKGAADFDLDVPRFDAGAFSISSVQLADQLVTGADASSPFSKNGYVVVPNVTGEIGGTLPQLASYVEVYNADVDAPEKIEVVYGLAIGQTKQVIYERADTLAGPFPEAFVLTDFMPVDSLPGGAYFLVVQVFHGLRSANVQRAVSATPFLLDNPSIDALVASKSAEGEGAIATSAAGIDPYFAGMTENELDLEWAKARYIARDFHKNVWEGLAGEEAKARFLSEFWAQLDDSPETPENEFRNDYFKRANDARVLYTTALAPHGWDSDRGRILLQLGRPDGIDRHPQDFNVRPYEIWSYSSLGYEFVFVDRQQTGLYVLVHSNAPRETRDENWMTDYGLINKKWSNE